MLSSDEKHQLAEPDPSAAVWAAAMDEPASKRQRPNLGSTVLPLSPLPLDIHRLILHYLDYSDLLTCRTVSQSWKVSVENHAASFQFFEWPTANVWQTMSRFQGLSSLELSCFDCQTLIHALPSLSSLTSLTLEEWRDHSLGSLTSHLPRLQRLCVALRDGATVEAGAFRACSLLQELDIEIPRGQRAHLPHDFFYGLPHLTSLGASGLMHDDVVCIFRSALASQLVHLVCEEIKGDAIDVPKGARLPRLRSLYLDWVDPSMLAALRDSTLLEVLDLDATWVGVPVATALASLLPCLTRLRFLRLPSVSEVCDDAPEDAKHQWFVRAADDAWWSMCTALTQLEELHIRRWPISQEAVLQMPRLRSLRRFEQLWGDSAAPTPWYFHLGLPPDYRPFFPLRNEPITPELIEFLLNLDYFYLDALRSYETLPHFFWDKESLRAATGRTVAPPPERLVPYLEEADSASDSSFEPEESGAEDDDAASA